jgi:hypothetical protein
MQSVVHACVALAGSGLLLLAAADLGAQNASERRQVDPRATPATIRVGPTHAVKSLAQAAKLARQGDVIEIEAGEYPGDVAVLDKNDLVVRGINGKPRLVASGKSAEGKGILVVRAENVVIENLALVGAKVRDRNGSGIRLERGSLTVRGASFSANEMAILTSNDPKVRLDVEGCDFEGDDSTDRHVSHVLYAGGIDRLFVQGSYFRRGKIGHLIKSRARESFFLYNRLSDETGTASYELEFPAGGFAVVIGNLIQQSPHTDNATLVSFGAEGYRWPVNALHLAHNTLVNDREQGGTFVAVRPGNASARLVNNLFLGPGQLDLKAPAESIGNASAKTTDFVNPAAFDYRLRVTSKLAGASGDPGMAGDVALRPAREYIHPAKTEPFGRSSALTPLSPGAFQRFGP